MKTRIYLLLILCLLLWCCSKKPALNLPQESSHLVIKNIGQEGIPFTMDIFKTQPLTSSNIYTQTDFIVIGATGVLYANGVIADTMLYSVSRKIYITRHNTIPIQGKTYSLKVSAPGVDDVTAQTVLPTQVTILNSSIIRAVATPAVDEIHFSFRDPGNETNYYRLFIRYPASLTGTPLRPVYGTANCIFTSDPAIAQNNVSTNPFDPASCIGSGRLFFTDASFNGQQKEMIIRVDSAFSKILRNPSNGSLYRPYVELWSITEQYYRYIQNINLFQEYTENPFAEPVITYTNVNGGYGIFAVYRLAIDTLR